MTLEESEDEPGVDERGLLHLRCWIQMMTWIKTTKFPLRSQTDSSYGNTSGCHSESVFDVDKENAVADDSLGMKSFTTGLQLVGLKEKV